MISFQLKATEVARVVVVAGQTQNPARFQVFMTLFVIELHWYRLAIRTREWSWRPSATTPPRIHYIGFVRQKDVGRRTERSYNDRIRSKYKLVGTVLVSRPWRS